MSHPTFDQVLSQVREVECSTANAERLWRSYQQAFLDDDELYRRIHDSETGIDGLTEPRTPADFESMLACQDVLALEIVDPDDVAGPPMGFVVVRYATDETDSIDRFRTYALEETADGPAWEFISREADRRFCNVLDEGNVGCYVEFISRRDKMVTLALRLASHQFVCVGRMGIDHCNFFSKCLDAARIGEQVNPHGNRPIKRMLQTVEMEPIASVWQTRTLSVSGKTITADLKFALLLGRSETTTALVAERVSKPH